MRLKTSTLLAICMCGTYQGRGLAAIVCLHYDAALSDGLGLIKSHR